MQWSSTIQQWVDDNLIQWGVIGETKDVFIDTDNAYIVTSNGLDIYDLYTEQLSAFVSRDGGFVTIFGNNDYIFLGTTDSGVKCITKSCISGSISSPINLESCLNDLSVLTPYYELTSNKIVDIHIYENVLCAITNSGVDVVKLNPQSFRSYTTVSGAEKCFITKDELYYIVNNELCIVNTYLVDWNAPTKCYSPGSGVLASGVNIKDLFVDTGGIDNFIYLATNSGIYIINESTDSYNVYGTNTYNSISILNNKIYASTVSGIEVVLYDTLKLYDLYTPDVSGRARELLYDGDLISFEVA